jgi:hypothetical protein
MLFIYKENLTILVMETWMIRPSSGDHTDSGISKESSKTVACVDPFAQDTTLVGLNTCMSSLLPTGNRDKLLPSIPSSPSWRDTHEAIHYKKKI